MAVQTAAGSKIHIGPVADATVDTALEFEALIYTEVEETESLAVFGDTVSEVTFTALNDRRVRKFKGSFNAGTIAVVMGRDAAAVGQAAFIAALASDQDYAFKVTLADAGPGSPSSPTTFYFRGKVMSYETDINNAENVVRANASVAINSAIIEVAAV